MCIQHIRNYDCKAKQIKNNVLESPSHIALTKAAKNKYVLSCTILFIVFFSLVQHMYITALYSKYSTAVRCTCLKVGTT